MALARREKPSLDPALRREGVDPLEVKQQELDAQSGLAYTAFPGFRNAARIIGLVRRRLTVTGLTDSDWSDGL